MSRRRSSRRHRLRVKRKTRHAEPRIPRHLARSKAAFAVFGIMLLGAIASVLGARRGTRDLLTLRGNRVAT